MTTGLAQAVPSGILLPASFLQSDFFAVLSAFVAINTIVYVALAVSKIFPKVYLVDWVKGAKRRSETRSIYPDAPIVREAGKHFEPDTAAGRHRADNGQTE